MFSLIVLFCGTVKSKAVLFVGTVSQVVLRYWYGFGFVWLFSSDTGYNIVMGVIVSMFVVGFGSVIVCFRPESEIRRTDYDYGRHS
jgi:hypothetical protein